MDVKSMDYKRMKTKDLARYLTNLEKKTTSLYTQINRMKYQIYELAIERIRAKQELEMRKCRKNRLEVIG